MSHIKLIAAVMFTLPYACFAVGPESCWLEGRAAGNSVKLDYIDDSAYGLASSRTYGYCVMGAKDENSWFMSCAQAKGGKETAYYETSKRGKNSTSVYVCMTGCGKGVVKKFSLECESGC